MFSPRTFIAALIPISLLGLPLVAAVPAQAAATPSTIYVSGCAPTPIVKTAASGGGSAVTSITWTSESDSLVITNECPSLVVEGYVGGSRVSQVGVPAGESRSINPLGTSINELRMYNVSTDITTIAMVPPAGGGANSTASSSSPAPITQQFGKPSTGTCDAAAPLTLNWGGADSGGWNDSWAEWMNDGKGGSVCTRTLVYSNVFGKWAVS